MLDDAEQESSRARRRIEQRHGVVDQPRRAEIFSKGAVERGDHIGHDLDRRVIDAIALARGGIEHLQEVFVKIQDRIGLSGPSRKDSRLETVHRVEDHVEADAHVADDFLLAQHPQGRAHQRMFRRHVVPRFAIDRTIRRLAHQQQAEGQRLCEGSREKRFETLGVVAGRLRMGVKHLAEFVADGLQRRVPRSGGGQFGEAVLDDAPNKSGRMG